MPGAGRYNCPIWCFLPCPIAILCFVATIGKIGRIPSLWHVWPWYSYQHRQSGRSILCFCEYSTYSWASDSVETKSSNNTESSYPSLVGPSMWCFTDVRILVSNFISWQADRRSSQSSERLTTNPMHSLTSSHTRGTRAVDKNKQSAFPDPVTKRLSSYHCDEHCAVRSFHLPELCSVTTLVL